MRPLSVGVITNVEAEVNQDADRVKSLLTEQAVRPVRWEESVRRLEALGCRRIFEVGPGKVLKGLIKRITSSLEVENFATAQDLARAGQESPA
jgi:[acyl-carrier-protein] S-malonyltransferase